MSDIFFYTSFAAYKTGAGGHKVIDILIIAIMSGAKSWEDIKSYEQNSVRS
ncbi:transposase family protein [Endozoicomonas acroporae]|uniref:transposase family protein n=1 Tax=Endozoicomonas acroporae TaxID=1701104 RepID=UPI0013D2F764|nr:transposase family protein [Endozoicomonas acroporae]